MGRSNNRVLARIFWQTVMKNMPVILNEIKEWRHHKQFQLSLYLAISNTENIQRELKDPGRDIL